MSLEFQNLKIVLGRKSCIFSSRNFGTFARGRREDSDSGVQVEITPCTVIGAEGLIPQRFLVHGHIHRLGKERGKQRREKQNSSLRHKVQFAGLGHLKQITLGKYGRENLMLIEWLINQWSYFEKKKVIEIALGQSDLIHLINVC